MSDAQLAWLLEHFGMKPATTKKLRHKLTVASEVRFARKVKITESGHVQKLWELVPIPKPVKPR
jgi:hypothetical protein